PSRRSTSVRYSVHTAYGPPFPASVSAVVSTHRPDHLGNVLSTFAQQVHADRELVLVAHGFEPAADLRARAKNLAIDNFTIVTASADLTLGACLNLGVEAACGNVIEKMDDDDIYGEHYLSDQLAALRYSHADLVGK